MDEPLVQLITFTPSPLAVVAFAARICKNSFKNSDTEIVKNLATRRGDILSDVECDVGENDIKLIEGCIAQGHDSILEHVSVTVRIDFSRAAQAQLLRHRISSYSAESSRVVEIEDCDKQERFYIPEKVKFAPERRIGGIIFPSAEDVFWDAIEYSLRAYKKLIHEYTIPVEDARYLMPLTLVQPVMATMNLRSWRHVIQERTCKHAQYEVRSAVKEIRRLIALISPIFIEGAENFKYCPQQCGLCLTNWEGIEDDSPIREG